MAHAFRLPFTLLLRPQVVTIPVRPDAAGPRTAAAPARDFPRRQDAAPALPPLWEQALPRPEPFAARRGPLRPLAPAWPALAAIAGDPLPEPNVEPDDPAAWRLSPPPPTPSGGWGGHEPPAPEDPEGPEDPDQTEEPAELVTDCYKPELPVAPIPPQEDEPAWLGAYEDAADALDPESPVTLPPLVTDCYEPDVAADLDGELASWFSTRDAASEVPEAPAPEPEIAAVPEPEPAAEREPVEAEPLPRTAEPVPVPESDSLPGPPVAADPQPVAAAQAPRTPLHRRELHLPRPRRRRSGSNRRGDVVGLRVGSSQIAAARVHVNGGFELVQLARTPLAPGVVVGGEVREPDALAAALKSFFAEHKLPRRNVRIGVASGRIGVRVVEVPPVDDPRHLENAIRFRAHEEIPIPVAEAVLDHVVIGDGTDADGNPVRRILVAFAHRDLVLRQVEACRKAGLRPLGVDLDAFALLRSVTSTEDSAGGTRALVAVAVGHERTVLAVSDGTVCDFTRVLEWGGANLDVALARVLDLTPSEANAVKHRLTLTSDGEVHGIAPERLETARGAARLELQNLAREIVSSLRYYQTRSGALDLGEIILTGGASQLPGALVELERAIGAPVRAGDPLARVSLGKKVQRPADAGSYAIAVGLGLDR